jgi:hypothetical protein
MSLNAVVVRAGTIAIVKPRFTVIKGIFSICNCIAGIGKLRSLYAPRTTERLLREIEDLVR